MVLYEKIGGISVYAEKNAYRDYTITLKEGEKTSKEIYFGDLDPAVQDFLRKKADIYTPEWLISNVRSLQKISEDDYRIGKCEWFRRIEGTPYFKYSFER